jgi:nucleoside-diphosphate-sugar epimerase
MNNLIIGSTSQLSKYFPENYEKISSRNINVDQIKKGGYDSVYILFAEQRTFLNEDEKFFNDTNVFLTLKIINQIKNYVKKIVVYSTSELWNNYDGKVFLTDKYDYNYTPYIKSKEILCNTINENKDQYENVHIIYPFNFNSPYRKDGFL